MSTRAHSARARPEDVLGRDGLTHAVHYTMGNFLSAEFERLYDEGLDIAGIKSTYFVRLLVGLNKLCASKVRTGGIRVEDLEQLELPLTAAYVRRMRMAKTIEESVGDYVDWTIDARYRALEKARKETVAAPTKPKSEEQKTQPAESVQPAEPPRAYMPRRRGRHRSENLI